MLNRIKVIGLVLLIVSFTGAVGFANNPDDIEALLGSGLAEKRSTKVGMEELLAEVKGKLEDAPNDYVLNWQYAALAYFYGDFFVKNANTKKLYFTYCKDYAWKAVKANKEGVAGHYWLGVGYAKWSEANGLLKSLFYADDVAREMTETIKRDPAFFNGVPWGVRATVYAFAPRVISVGNPDKSRADILKALEYGKTYRVTYQVAANVYMHFEEWEKALVLIQKGLALPYNPLQKVEEKECIKTLKKFKKTVDAKIAEQSAK